MVPILDQGSTSKELLWERMPRLLPWRVSSIMRIQRNGPGSMTSLDQALIRISWPSTNTAYTTKTQNSITPKHKNGDPYTTGSNTPDWLHRRRRVHIMIRLERLVREPRWIPPTTVSRPPVSALASAQSWSTHAFALQARDLIDHQVISAMSTSGNSHSDPWTFPVTLVETTPKENSMRRPTRLPSQECRGALETPPLLINTMLACWLRYSTNFKQRIPSSIPCKYRPRDPRYLHAKLRKTPGKLPQLSIPPKRGRPSPRKTVLTISITKTSKSNKCQRHRKSTRSSIIRLSNTIKVGQPGPKGRGLPNQS